MAKWYERAFGAAIDEVGAAVADVRTKLIDEAWFGRMGTKPNPAEPAPEHDQSPGNDPQGDLFGEPLTPTPYPEAPVRFYDLPSDKPAPPEPSPEQDHGIDR
jgi:hypothetical protein